MKILLFGATGMVGQGALRECLAAPDVEQVLAVVRSSTGLQHPKFTELIHKDFLDYSTVEAELTGFDACFFCLGISSVGLTAPEYERITHDFTLAAARTLVRLNPKMSFLFISGAGTDSTEQGRAMWARVKGKTENDLLRLPFKMKVMLRPAFIQPMHGIRSKTKLYNFVYALTKPVLPLLKRLFPKYVTTTQQIGIAMLKIARQGTPKPVLENDDINHV